MTHEYHINSFEALPNTAFVRQPTVEKLYACSPASVWRWVQQGIIPAPRKIGRNSIWNVGELRESLAAVKGGQS